MKLQKEEKLVEIFEKCDINHSGYVDKSELRFVLEKMGLMNRDIHDFLMKRYDEDYNGMLDFDEFWYAQRYERKC